MASCPLAARFRTGFDCVIMTLQGPRMLVPLVALRNGRASENSDFSGIRRWAAAWRG